MEIEKPNPSHYLHFTEWCIFVENWQLMAQFYISKKDYIFLSHNFKFEAIEYNLTLHFKCLVGAWEEFGRAKTSPDSNNEKNLVEFKINPPFLITVLLVYCAIRTVESNTKY